VFWGGEKAEGEENAAMLCDVVLAIPGWESLILDCRRNESVSASSSLASSKIARREGSGEESNIDIFQSAEKTRRESVVGENEGRHDEIT